jgi:zinc and cadmium transporter
LSLVVRLSLYSLGVVVAAVIGGSLPIWSRGHSNRLELFLAGSAGVMFGVLGAHMLPEAFEAGPAAGWAIVGGFVFMLLVERFVLPHALHAPYVAEEHSECDPSVEEQHVKADAAGIGTFIGLALHTLGDGLALGASMDEPHAALLVFAAICAHKVPSAFALGSILVRAKVRTPRVLGAAALLGGMVAIGSTLFLAIQAAGHMPSGQLTPYAVGFSAGSFLHVAVTDLLPDLHRRGARKTRLIVAFLGGLVGMILLSIFLRT